MRYIKTITCTLALTLTGIGHAGDPTGLPNPVLFVTQVPIAHDFRSIGASFGNHEATVSRVGRGGDLMIIYPDGTLRNLTEEAGYGNDGMQGADSISVRQPCVHFSADRALFSMVIGATEEQYHPLERYWQIYEITGFGQGETPVITLVPNQPAEYNNISPVYSSDGRILYTSDRPHNGAAHLYPPTDEYESSPTVSGVWSLDPTDGDLDLLSHAPSGAFSLSVDSFGRVIFTKWDHLQRDQQADSPHKGGPDYGAYTYESESPDALPTSSDEDFFPEPRRQWVVFIEQNPDYNGPMRGYEPRHVGQSMETFQPWRVNQDGTEEETINHVGRQELLGYFNKSFNNDLSLETFFLRGGEVNVNRITNLFRSTEDPTSPGRFYAINAPTFQTHAAGQIVSFPGHPDLNGDDFVVTYVTHLDTARPDDDPSPDHSGLYRNLLPMTDGTLLTVHTNETRGDRNDGSFEYPTTRYDLRLKPLDTTGEWAVAGTSITGGITKTVQFWSPDTMVFWDGLLWELDPVEVVARALPPLPQPTLLGPEAQAIADAHVPEAGVRNFLRKNNLALIVSRNVTSRDQHDRQQPFNLRITDTDTETRGDDGMLYDVSFLQLFQGDQIRSLTVRDGRRVLAVPMHDAMEFLPEIPGQESSVRLGTDGSMAALVPARRAMTWQLTDDAGEAVVRERYWLTFQPGEIRACTSCHGLNTLDQAGALEPTNTPAALTDLLIHLRDAGEIPACPAADLNSDCIVGLADLLILLDRWGTDDADADLNADGLVGFLDLIQLLDAWN